MRTTLSILIGFSALATAGAMAAAPAGGTMAPPAGASAAGGAGTADASKEIDTALAHAQMAVAAKGADEAHQHLHHVINCLEGQNGKDFDSSTQNPCDGMGQGALNDVGESSAQHKKLESALKSAKSGLKKKSEKWAKHEAKNAVKDLQEAQKAKS